MNAVNSRKQHRDRRHRCRSRIEVRGNISHKERNQAQEYNNPGHCRVVNIVIRCIHVIGAVIHDERDAENDAVMPEILPPEVAAHKIRNPVSFMPEAVQAPAGTEKDACFINQNVRHSSVKELQGPDGKKGCSEPKDNRRCQENLHCTKHGGHGIFLRKFPKEEINAQRSKRCRRKVEKSPNRRGALRLRNPVIQRGLQCHTINPAVMIEAGLIQG